MPTPFNDQWRLPYGESWHPPHRCKRTGAMNHMAADRQLKQMAHPNIRRSNRGAAQGPIKPAEPIDDTLSEIPKVGTTDAPG
jgi:hypothetical protein